MGIWTQRAKTVKPYMELGKLAAEVGITSEDMPEIATSRPSYKWEPMLNTSSKVIGWQEVEDPDAQGTADNPIEWQPGMAVYPNYYYTYDGVRYVCVEEGSPTEISDEYFVQF